MLKVTPMDELIDQLETNYPELEWEVERSWVWLLTDLAPLHKGKCQCEECARRAALRLAIGRQGLGFSYAPRGHQCPSGAISYWGHRAEHPTKFRHHKKTKGSEPATETSEVSDEQLLAMIG
jgi:hypothetical protein